MAQKLIEFQTENSHSIAWLSSNNKKRPKNPLQITKQNKQQQKNKKNFVKYRRSIAENRKKYALITVKSRIYTT